MIPMEKEIVFYGKNKIEFFIKRKNVKNINLTVTPDEKVIVSANDKVSIEYLKDFIKRKSKWIHSNLKYFNANQQIKTEKNYISGETFKYLGRQYRLKLIESDFEEIKFLQGYICLYVTDKTDLSKKKNLINKWYKEKSENIFNEILKKVFKELKYDDINFPKIRIRNMKKRWGSFLKEKNEIFLNFELIKASKYCIEYVILHELLHYKYENHDKNFYNMMTMIMPDWKNRKEILDKDVIKEL
jgi:hypothetical protein